jgi:putative FmdB family regulatory protein
MPLYEYQCEKCGDIFEAMQKFSDEPIKVHEKCGGDVRRLLSAPALQFKGSGWYVNDYAKGSSSTPSSKSDSESSTKSDAGKSEPAKSGSTKSDGASAATPTPTSADKK